MPVTAPLPRLATSRLLLRPVEEADAAATSALVTPDVAANLSTWPSPMTTAQALAKIRESKRLVRRRKAIDFAILNPADGRLMGWIGLAAIGARTARLGYWIGLEFRGHGYTREAARAAVPAGAQFVEATTVVALVLPNNLASMGVLDALGFTEVGQEEFYFETARISRLCQRYIWSTREKGLPRRKLAD